MLRDGATAPLGKLLTQLCSSDAAERERAWASCYREYSRLVWTRVFFVVRTIPDEPDPRETTADIVSMVFLGLPSAARSYREQGKAEQWLNRVAIRTALRYKESRTGQWSSRPRSTTAHGDEDACTPNEPLAAPPTAGRRQVSLEDVVDEVAALLDDAEREDLRIEFRARLDAWRADPEKARWVRWVEMYCEGYAHEEIADALGITPGVSRNWFKRITTALGSQPAWQGAHGR